MSSWLSKCKHEVMINSQQQLTPGISSQVPHEFPLFSQYRCICPPHHHSYPQHQSTRRHKCSYQHQSSPAQHYLSRQLQSLSHHHQTSVQFGVDVTKKRVCFTTVRLIFGYVAFGGVTMSGHMQEMRHFSGV